MDATRFREMLERHFELSRTDAVAAHAIYHDDAVLEFPQSGERFVGVASFVEWRSDYPATVEYEIASVRGSDDLWVVELTLRFDDGPTHFGISPRAPRRPHRAGDDLRRGGLGGARVAGALEGSAVGARRASLLIPI